MSDLKIPLSCEQFEAHVSDYIDGALSDSERAAMDAHSAQCASCLAMLSEVRAIVGNAASLPALSASRDLWSGIAERLDTPVVSIGSSGTVAVKRTRTFSIRQFAAAAALLISVSSGITYVVMRGSTSAAAPRSTIAAVPTPATVPTAAASVASEPATGVTETNSGSVRPSAAAGVASSQTLADFASSERSRARFTSRTGNSAEVAYEREISAMRRIVDERLGDLDSVTVVEIERNLQIIDKAIGDSRRALQNDPRSRFLSKQLDRALESKLDIMRRIAQL